MTIDKHKKRSETEKREPIDPHSGPLDTSVPVDEEAKRIEQEEIERQKSLHLKGT